MKNICIIGNSVAGLTCAKTIRENDKESKISIISDESHLPYQRYKLLNFLRQEIRELELFKPYTDFYKQNNIELINNIVVSFDASKKRLYYKEKGYLEFDVLVVATGRKPALPEIKGINKKGIIALHKLDDIKQIIEILPLIHTVGIVGGNNIAQSLVEFFVNNKVDVKLISSAINITIDSNHVEQISNLEVQEVLGNGDIKAMRFTNNKVVGVNLLIYTDVLVPNISLVKDAGVECGKGILVDSLTMSTNIKDVYAAGDVTEVRGEEKIFAWDRAEQEGIKTGRYICQI